MINMISSNDLDDEALILLHKYHQRVLKHHLMDNYSNNQLRTYKLVSEIVKHEIQSRNLKLTDTRRSNRRVKYLNGDKPRQFNNNSVLPTGFEHAHINRK